MSETSVVLSASGLLSRLNKDDIAQVEAIARLRREPAGAEIFSLGETARALYLVEEGTVALRLPLTIRGVPTEVTLEEKQRGAVIAWSALVPPHRLTLSAQAVTDVVLIALDVEKLEEVFLRNSRIHLVLMNNLCRVIGSRVSLLEARLLRDLQRWVIEKYDQPEGAGAELS